MMVMFWLKELRSLDGLSWRLLPGVLLVLGSWLSYVWNPSRRLISDPLGSWLPWRGASLSWGLPKLVDPPGCWLVGARGLVHASLDRAGSGMLGLIRLNWTVFLDCCVLFIPTNLLLLPVYALQRSNKMHLRPEQMRNILERNIRGMLS